MRFAGQHRPERQIGMEMAPMIDVVLLLIIFFMTTAQFVERSRAELDLPEEPGEQREDADDRELVINILEDGSILVADQTFDLDGLRETISRAVQEEGDAAQARVLIRADRDAGAEQLNSVIELLQEQGVGSAQFATEVPQ